MYDEIIKQAWQKEPPKDASLDKQIIYCIARSVYADFAEGSLEQDEAQRMKDNLIYYFEMLFELAHSNSEIIKELAKATAPRKDLVKKDKAELLDVISRIEGVVTGMMKSYGDSIPKILKFDEVRK